MNPEIPNLPASAPDAEQLRLKTLFDELRKNQLTFLDEAGKRIIELSTGMLSILFAVIALGKDFPPPYLANFTVQIMAVVTLMFFFLALLAGFRCVQPREYKDFSSNLSGMRAELAKHTHFKVLWFRIGSALFVLGAFWLVCLIVSIILNHTP